MISFKNIALRRGPRLLFEKVDLLLNSSERIGLVGENGCGKSSLFAMIIGDLGADQGDLTLNENLVVAHVAQETPASDQSALDYVLDGDVALREVERAIENIDHATQGALAGTLYAKMAQMDGYSAPSRAARLLHGLGFTQGQFGATTQSFSGGWRVRLNLARALMCPSDILLLDEPTNHLDLDAVVWLEDWLSSYQGLLLMISHDRDFLDGICQRILHIENGLIRSYTGNYSRFEVIRGEQLANEQAAFEQQQREVAHMQNYIRRFKAKATKAKQAQSRVKALERMEMIAPAHINSPFRFGFFEPAEASDPLLKLQDAAAGYGDTNILENLNLSIGSHQRIGLVGANGAGKSTLIKLLAGGIKPNEGEITLAKSLNIGYFAQHQLEQLDVDATPLTQMQRVFPRITHQEVRNYLGGFGFRGERVSEKIGPFSGGEKARLALAILIYHKPNLLLMDEPTNHLDLEMRYALTLAFQKYEGAILLVSHDRHLIRTVTDQLWLVHDGAVELFSEDIDGYMKWARQQKSAAANSLDSTGKKSVKTADGLSKKERRQEAARLREQVKPITKAIRSLESKMEQDRQSLAALEAELSDTDTYENESTARLAQMMQKKTGLEKSIENAEMEWLEQSEKLEALQASIAG